MDLDIRYVAGLFDGEGWITICKQRLGGYGTYHRDYVRYQLVAGIGMTYRPIVEMVHQQFGGALHINRSAQARLPKSRAGYLWKVSSTAASAFLSLLVSELIVKKEEALLGIAFQEHVNKYRGHYQVAHPEMRPIIYAERERFRLQLRSLKKLTFDSPIDDDPISEAA